MEIKVVNAGNCVICGREIKIDIKRGDNKLPNIFFCPECERQRMRKGKSLAEGEDKK